VKPHPVIDHERRLRRTNAEIVRRLYGTEPPAALRDAGHIHFDICNTVSEFFRIPIYLVRAAGSAQTGFSFHQNKDFIPKLSDLDLAVVSGEVFERYLRAVQRVVLPSPETLQKPNRHTFPTKQGESYYNEFVTNVSFYRVLMPYQMPICPEKSDLSRMTSKLSEKYAEEFSDINIAIYLSDKFFERKQNINIGFYDHGIGS
jgi:hypothetical protein